MADKASRIHALTANFSLFGGAIENFASQLAELPDRLDRDALVEAVVGRIRADKIQVLVLDDLHWADLEGLKFLQALLAALMTIGTLVVLVSRPSGGAGTHAETGCGAEVVCAANASRRRACTALSRLGPIATEAARRSGGSPLFVEQFTAWAAEANFRGGQSGPRTLYQIIATR